MKPEEFLAAVERVSSVARLSLAAGDRVLIEVDRDITVEQAAEMGKQLKACFPDHDVVIVAGGRVSVERIEQATQAPGELR